MMNIWSWIMGYSFVLIIGCKKGNPSPNFVAKLKWTNLTFKFHMFDLIFEQHKERIEFCFKYTLLFVTIEWPAICFARITLRLRIILKKTEASYTQAMIQHEQIHYSYCGIRFLSNIPSYSDVLRVQVASKQSRNKLPNVTHYSDS